jgi:predicted regulator of Ras-like GTPase activity (Roadblock/LC7/MglB family)
VSAYGELLARVNRISGVRGSMVVAAEDGLIVEEDLMVGVPGPAAAALVASLFRRARRSVQAAEFGSASYLPGKEPVLIESVGGDGEIHIMGGFWPGAKRVAAGDVGGAVAGAVAGSFAGGVGAGPGALAGGAGGSAGAATLELLRLIF